MNNGIFSQDIYGKVGFDAGLPRPLLGAPSINPMPYHYPGGDWKIDLINKFVFVVDTRAYSVPVASCRIPSGTATIDWGDGIIETRSGSYPIHNYASHGIYIIQVYNLSNSEFGIGTQAITVDPYPLNIIKCLSFGNKITNLRSAFRGCSNLIQVPTTMGSHVMRVYNMFGSCNNLNQDLSAYDFTGLSDDGIGKGFQGMFSGCSKFNNGGVSLNTWNTNKSTSMFQMFNNTNFNQDIGSWDTSNMTDMSFAFDSSPFNNGGSSSINNWNTGNVTNMSQMFSNSSFNQNIGNFNVSKVTNFYRMFINNTVFNNGGSTDINNWILNTNPSVNISMGGIFYGATSFNQPIGSWNTIRVTDMAQMIYMPGQAGPFNQNLGTWNTSNVTSMLQTFYGCNNFNNGGSNTINNWNVSKVTTMNGIFNLASSFNQPISNWNIAGLNINTGLDTLMSGKTGTNAYSTTNYDGLLTNWNNNKSLTVNGIANWRIDLRPDFGGSKYTAGSAAATARAALVTYGWTITDGGSI